MKICEAINRLDSLLQNTYSEQDKVEWLSKLDWMVKRHIIDTHEGDVPYKGYDEATDLNTELLIPAPYDEVYLRWLEAKIHYYNGEYEKYNNAVDMFNTEFNAYKNLYNREHMPKGKSFKYF